MLTSRATELDRVLGLEMGADDYLTKPFSVMELMARVKAMFRRVKAVAAGTMTRRPRPSTSGDLMIDVQRRQVTCREPIRTDGEGVRPAAAFRAESGPGLHARPIAGLRLGLQPQRLRTYGQFPHQPPARQDRGRPGEPCLRQDGLGRRATNSRTRPNARSLVPSRRCVGFRHRGSALVTRSRGTVGWFR